jgi:ribosomal-protein-alanine N-acetyltransferase
MLAQVTSIRLIDIQDADALAAHLARDEQAFARWQPAQPARHYTLEGQLSRIELLLEDYRNGHRWPGAVLADGVVIGQVTVSTILRGPFRKGSIGYWIASTYQNQGHASRAVHQVLKIMVDELDLHRAEAHTQMENLASQRVLRKNGFTSFGIAHSHFFVEGAWRDDILWERTLEP